MVSFDFYINLNDLYLLVTGIWNSFAVFHFFAVARRSPLTPL